ncbi:Serine/threonine protein kinase [Elasticomyces elasticus]|nr:Serine/threonine protein kinase [Elasticomyces elasticus]
MKLADFGLATTEKVTADMGCGSTFYMSPECSRPSRRFRYGYASAPNDIWSLGIILINLTCGRNPWKKASSTDTTFRAFLKDPDFLSTILPISPELNRILRYVFDTDPTQRLTVPELRKEILACPRFTVQSCPDVISDYDTIIDEAIFIEQQECQQFYGLPTPPTLLPSTAKGNIASSKHVSVPKQVPRPRSSFDSDDSGYGSEDNNLVSPQPQHQRAHFVPSMYDFQQQYLTPSFVQPMIMSY